MSFVERIIKAIMQSALKIAKIMIVLAFFIKAMVGVYRLANLSWNKHLFFGFIYTIALLILNIDGVNLLDILIVLTVLSLGSKGLLSLFNRFNIYESFANASDKHNDKEWMFAFFSSIIIVFSIIIGLILWNGTVIYTDMSLISFFGYIFLLFGFGLTIIGFVCSYIIKKTQSK